MWVLKMLKLHGILFQQKQGRVEGESSSIGFFCTQNKEDWNGVMPLGKSFIFSKHESNLCFVLLSFYFVSYTFQSFSQMPMYHGYLAGRKNVAFQTILKQSLHCKARFTAVFYLPLK